MGTFGTKLHYTRISLCACQGSCPGYLCGPSTTLTWHVTDHPRMGNVPGKVVLSPCAARLRVTSVILPHVVELRFIH